MLSEIPNVAWTASILLYTVVVMLDPSGPVPVSPCDFVVFGGTGDLAVRKLLPALFLRDRDGQLPAETRVIAASRAGLDVRGYRDKVRGELGRFVAKDAVDQQTLERFLARLDYA